MHPNVIERELPILFPDVALLVMSARIVLVAGKYLTRANTRQCICMGIDEETIRDASVFLFCYADVLFRSIRTIFLRRAHSGKERHDCGSSKMAIFAKVTLMKLTPFHGNFRVGHTNGHVEWDSFIDRERFRSGIVFDLFPIMKLKYLF